MSYFDMRTAVICLLLGSWIAPILLMGAIDLVLALRNHETLSQYVWKHPTSGIPVIFWLLIGPAFLAGHFWLRWFRDDGVLK